MSTVGLIGGMAALALVITAILTPAVRRFAVRRRLLDDQTSSRKVHDNAVPRLGGLAIACGFYVPLVAALTVLPEAGLGPVQRALVILAGGAVILLLGCADDVHGLNARHKLAVQLPVALGLFACGVSVEQVHLPLAGDITLGVLSLPVTVLWVVGVTNAMNLIDGHDGLASGVALLAAVAGAVIATLHGNLVMAATMACLAAAILGFLFYNLPPASIFMGDTGSMFLGYILATCAIEIHRRAAGSPVVSALPAIVALGVPIADTSLVVLRRALTARPLFLGDREHLHHRLAARGLGPWTVLLTLCGGAAMLGIVAVAIAGGTRSELWTIAGLFTCALMVLLRPAVFESGSLTRALARRRRNLALHAGLRVTRQALRGARSLADIGRLVSSFGEMMHAAGATTSLELVWYPTGTDNRCSRTYPVGRARSPVAHVLARWDGGGELDRDHEIAVEKLCNLVGLAIQRLTTLEKAAARRTPASAPQVDRLGPAA